jgi:hypothetical protein
MMHTETNRMDAREGPRWLWRQWHNVQLIRRGGVPVVGFTWYSRSFIAACMPMLGALGQRRPPANC